jgi:hypothetical protein
MADRSQVLRDVAAGAAWSARSRDIAYSRQATGTGGSTCIQDAACVSTRCRVWRSVDVTNVAKVAHTGVAWAGTGGKARVAADRESGSTQRRRYSIVLSRPSAAFGWNMPCYAN